MNRLSILLFYIGMLASLTAAASAPTFCKCTCFTNSTIIEIKSKSTTGISPPHLNEEGLASESNNNNNNDNEDTSSSSAFPFTTPDLSGIDVAGEADASDPPSRRSPPLVRNNEKVFDRHLRRAAPVQMSPSCSQCNRAFCLSQSLPICKGATEKDVVTMCFQRDSRKDQIVVWGFILGTAGLLGWAALRKVVEMQERGAFIGAGGLVSGGGGGGGGGGGISSRGRDGGAVSIGRGISGSTGHDSRGQYTGVAGHSRENSAAMG